MPSSYTTDAILLTRTMGELGYKPRNIVAQASGFSDKAFLDAMGDKVGGLISRASFALDMAQKRPSVLKVNEMYKARSKRDLNDSTSRELMGLLVLADAIDRAKSTNGEKFGRRWQRQIFRARAPSCRGNTSGSVQTGRTPTQIRCWCSMSVERSSRSFPRRWLLPRRCGR